MSQVMAPASTTASDKIDYEANWFGTVRARLGYSVNNVLFYGTGGLAYGEMDVTQKLAAENGTESATWKGSTNGWNLGWTLGGGIEYSADRWVKSESCCKFHLARLMTA
jgi:outer membrane immunogenic protein